MSSERQWIGVSDLMSVLMMVFLFIAIVFMLKIQQDQQQLAKEHEAIQAIAMDYAATKEGIHTQLQQTFSDHLKKWNAAILDNGAIRFSRPQSLFSVGSSDLTPTFQSDLNKFFPQYITLLASSKWKNEIEEIRIEGHTSSDWKGGEASDTQRYLHNAQLSQARAFAVLEYVYNLPAVAEHRPWLKTVLRATGASSAKPALVNGIEDESQSRRVEFSAKTRSEEKIKAILQNLERNLPIGNI